MQDRNINQNTTDNQSARKECFKNKAGDFIGKAGRKISAAGAQRIGQKIHSIGDSLEKNQKDFSYPQKV